MNLVLMRMGMLSARNMTKRLDIPYFFNPVTYNIEKIVSNYHQLADVLGEICPDFTDVVDQTKLIIQATKEHVGDYPIIVDSSATMLPYAMTKALLQYGFNIIALFASLKDNEDSEEQNWIMENYPAVCIVQEDSYEAVAGYGFNPECLVIGYDSAYLTGRGQVHTAARCKWRRRRCCRLFVRRQ